MNSRSVISQLTKERFKISHLWKRMLHIDPAECLLDEIVSIKINQLNPGQQITVRSEVTEGKFVYDAHAHFVASLDGVVDINNDPSFGGNYKGVSSMGIFSSMVPAKGQRNGLRYFPANCIQPMRYKLQVYNGHLSDESFQKSELLTPKGHEVKYPLIGNISNLVKSPIREGVALRKCNAEDVIREEVRHGRVRGTIFKPPGAGPFKGVIDFYGAIGGINESRVALLASRGFIAFTLPHHRYDDLVKDFNDVDIEYFLEAIEYFSSLNTVQPNIGVLGTCAGGSIAILLSTLSSNISTVVTFNTSYGHTQNFGFMGEKVKGLEEYYINSDLLKNLSYGEHGGVYLNEFLNLEPVDDLAVKIEESNAKFLIIIGEDDKTMNSVVSGKYMVNRMQKNGKGNQITLLSYPGTGHFIDPTYMPQTQALYYPHAKLPISIGGNVVDNASASYHCWNQLLTFLRCNIGVPSKY